jgi:hypothetical protein
MGGIRAGRAGIITPRTIRDAQSIGVDGRPPVQEWTPADVRHFHPAKLSAAELIALWRRGGLQPRPLLYREIIGRGLWRQALNQSRYLYQDNARCFIQVVEAAIDRGRDIPRGLRSECQTIAEGGLLEHLRQALYEVDEMRGRIQRARNGLYERSGDGEAAAQTEIADVHFGRPRAPD